MQHVQVWLACQWGPHMRLRLLTGHSLGREGEHERSVKRPGLGRPIVNRRRVYGHPRLLVHLPDNSLLQGLGSLHKACSVQSMHEGELLAGAVPSLAVWALYTHAHLPAS